MRIEHIRKNFTKVSTKNAMFIVSYQTPVVIHTWQHLQHKGIDYPSGLYVTDQFHSVTTSAHINQYLGHPYQEEQRMPQEFINRLFEEV